MITSDGYRLLPVTVVYCSLFSLNYYSLRVNITLYRHLLRSVWPISDHVTTLQVPTTAQLPFGHNQLMMYLMMIL